MNIELNDGAKKMKKIIPFLVAVALVIGVVSPASVENAYAASQIPITKATITLSYTNVNWDGKEKKPAVTVKYNSKKLKKGTDYEIIGYVNNVKPGRAYVSIKGIGKYTGAVEKYFNINQTTYLMKADFNLNDGGFFPANLIVSATGKITDKFTWAYDDKGVKNVTAKQQATGIKALAVVYPKSIKCTERKNGREEWKSVYEVRLLKPIKIVGNWKVATLTTYYQISGGNIYLLQKKSKLDILSKW